MGRKKDGTHPVLFGVFSFGRIFFVIGHKQAFVPAVHVKRPDQNQTERDEGDDAVDVSRKDRSKRKIFRTVRPNSPKAIYPRPLFSAPDSHGHQREGVKIHTIDNVSCSRLDRR